MFIPHQDFIFLSQQRQTIWISILKFFPPALQPDEIGTIKLSEVFQVVCKDEPYRVIFLLCRNRLN